MSALPPKADIKSRIRDVRFVPKAVVSRCGKNPLSKAHLFDHLVSSYQQGLGNAETDRLRRLQIND
jgi:hypothetical protein